MSIFKSRDKKVTTQNPTVSSRLQNTNNSKLAEIALNSILDGVIIVDEKGLIKMANPAAAVILGYSNPADLVGLDCMAIIKLEGASGGVLNDEQNPIVHAIRTNQLFRSKKYSLVLGEKENKMSVSISVIPTAEQNADKIIVFRDITQERKEEDAKIEFISTASHEMRTPVASIEGYLGLALNPATATIDKRAEQYLNEAHQASQHLGRLFRDLLDVTKLEDGKIPVRWTPVELTETVKKISDEHIPEFQKKSLQYVFGAPNAGSSTHILDQIIYSMVDIDFLREILDNLIENAVKYTPEGGLIQVNVSGDNKRAVISIADTGIGIGTEDLLHIFQKFYRADNSQTRTIGGTGLGLYIVKARTEALGGKVWAESDPEGGKGTTFHVALPRISNEEYERGRIALENAQAMQAFQNQTITNNNQNGGQSQ